MAQFLRSAFLSALVFPLITFAEEASQVEAETTQHRFRDEPLQWTSQSITVISAPELEETYRRDLEDLEGLAPGLLIDSLSTTPRGAAISIRGVGSRAISNSSFPAVGITVNGVYLGTHASQNQSLFDLESVEVVRGPSGTFGGAPTAGGSINLYRTKPTRDVSSKIRASFGDFNRKRFDGTFNFPILENMAGKIAINWKRGGAKVMQNANSFRKENEDHFSAGSVSLIWRGKNDASVQYTYDSIQDLSDVPALLNLSDSSDLLCDNLTGTFCSNNSGGIIPETIGLDVTTQNFSNNREYNVNQHAVEARFSLLDHEVTSITASRKSDEDSNQDLDGTSADFYSTVRSQKYKQVSQEFNVFRQLTPVFSYNVGAYYLSNEFDTDRADFFILDARTSAGLLPTAVPGELRDLHTEQSSVVRSVFGQFDFQFSERWILDLGAKWTEVDNDFYHVASLPGGPSVNEIDAFEQDDEISSSLGLSYRVDEDASFFMRYTHGFRPGGYDDAANSEDGAEVGDEDVDLFEAGIKTQWFDNRLRFNYVTYRNKYSNKAERVTQYAASGLLESSLTSVANIENRGHEIEIEALPLPNLLVRASLSHMNADYLSYSVADLTDPTMSIDNETLIPILSPADMFHLSGLYSFPYGEGTVRLYAGYRFTTEYRTDLTSSSGKIDNFTIIDLSAEFEWRDWKFRLFSRNANDKRYLTSVNSYVDGQVVSLPATSTSSQGLFTSAEVSQPEFTGLEVIYTPQFGK